MDLLREVARGRTALRPAGRAVGDARWHDHRARARSVRSRRAGSADADVRLEQLSRSDAPSGGRQRGARAAAGYGTGTTGSRTANGTLAHPRGARAASSPTGSGKRYALIFSTGYQANLSLIGGLCGAGDVILIDSDSHASIYDATRQTAAQVIGFRHNSPESLRRKLERLPVGGSQPAGRGRRSVFDSRRRRAAARDRRRCAARTALICWSTKRTRSATFGATGLGCAEDQGVPRAGRFHRRARSRNRWPASAASASRTIASCARCTSWRAPTCSPLPDRRPTSRVWAPRCASSAPSRAARSAVVEHPAAAQGIEGGSATRSVRASRRLFRF